MKTPKDRNRNSFLIFINFVFEYSGDEFIKTSGGMERMGEVIDVLSLVKSIFKKKMMFIR